VARIGRYLDSPQIPDAPADFLESCRGIQSPPPLGREISVDCMGYKDGDTKQSQDYCDCLNHFYALRYTTGRVRKMISFGQPIKTRHSRAAGASRAMGGIAGTRTACPEADSPAAAPDSYRGRAFRIP
jgi:hypothetical protein